jgi:hypothetical protein
MANTVATLNTKVVLDAGDLVEGLKLTKKEMREAAKIAEATTDSLTRLEQEQAKLTRFARGGQLNPNQFATAMRQAEEKFIPLAELVPERKQLTAKDFLPKGFDSNALKKNTAIKDLTEDVGGMNKTFGLTPFVLNPVGIALTAVTAGATAAGAAIGTLGAIVMSRIEAIDNLGDAAERLGVGAGELSGLKTAAILGDVDPAATDSLMQKMLVNLGKGDEAFASIGLSVEELKGKGTGQIFAEVSAAISAIPDKSGQFAAMVDIFGKSGPEAANLITNFARLREEALMTGAVVGDQLAAKVSDADDAMKRAKLTAEGWANTLTDVAAPAVTVAANALAELGQSREGTSQVLANLGQMVGGNAGRDAGSFLGGLLNDQRDAVILDALLSQQLGDSNKAVMLNLNEEESVRKQILDLENEAERAEVKRAESIAKIVESLNDEANAIRMNNAERIQLKVQRAGGNTENQDDAMFAQDMLDFANQKKQVEDEAAKNNARNQQDELNRWKELDGWEARAAIRDIDNAERIKDAQKTDRQKADDATGDAAKLHAAGLLTDDELNKAIRLQADGLAKQRGGQVGVAGAEKGTAAGRMAVLETKHADRQIKLLEEIALSLRTEAMNPPIVVKEMGE